MNPKDRNIYVRKVAKYGLISIWIVNGKLVRKKYYIDFTQGGHHWRYRWVPENEIWIDNALPPDELDYVILHELNEMYLMMTTGMDYPSAHDRSASLELEYRKNKLMDVKKGIMDLARKINIAIVSGKVKSPIEGPNYMIGSTVDSILIWCASTDYMNRVHFENRDDIVLSITPPSKEDVRLVNSLLCGKEDKFSGFYLTPNGGIYDWEPVTMPSTVYGYSFDGILHIKDYDKIKDIVLTGGCSIVRVGSVYDCIDSPDSTVRDLVMTLAEKVGSGEVVLARKSENLSKLVKYLEDHGVIDPLLEGFDSGNSSFISDEEKRAWRRSRRIFLKDAGMLERTLLWPYDKAFPNYIVVKKKLKEDNLRKLIRNLRKKEANAERVSS